jgi:hypothetical protein
MRVILSAAGRAALRDAAIAFLALATGILNAPNLNIALGLAGAASIAAVTAAIRALRVFVPQFSEALVDRFGIPESYTEVAFTALQTLVGGFLAMWLAVLAAPDLSAAKAAGLAGVLAIGTALVRVAQAWLTPGETPLPDAGITVPVQPVPPEALSPTEP